MDIKRAGSSASDQRTSGIFHRNGPHRPAVRSDRARARGRQRGHLRAWRAHRLAYPSARSGSHRHDGLRPGAARGRPDRGNSPRRRRCLRARREALARRRAHDRHDPYRHPGGARRQGGRLDGEGERRAISSLSSRFTNLTDPRHRREGVSILQGDGDLRRLLCEHGRVRDEPARGCRCQRDPVQANASGILSLRRPAIIRRPAPLHPKWGLDGARFRSTRGTPPLT